MYGIAYANLIKRLFYKKWLFVFLILKITLRLNNRGYVNSTVGLCLLCLMVQANLYLLLCLLEQAKER